MRYPFPKFLLACAVAIVIPAAVFAQAPVAASVPGPEAGPAGWLPAEARRSCAGLVPCADVQCADVEHLRCRARAALERNSLDWAIIQYRKILKKYPDDGEANMGTAYAYYFLGDMKRCRRFLDNVVRGAGGFTPTAIMLRANLEFHQGCYSAMRDSGLALAEWGRISGYRLASVDGYLLASRACDNYLDDCEGTYRYLDKAKALLRPEDKEAAARVAGQERDVRHWREGRW